MKTKSIAKSKKSTITPKQDIPAELHMVSKQSKICGNCRFFKFPKAKFTNLIIGKCKDSKPSKVLESDCRIINTRDERAKAFIQVIHIPSGLTIDRKRCKTHEQGLKDALKELQKSYKIYLKGITYDNMGFNTNHLNTCEYYMDMDKENVERIVYNRPR